MTTRAAGLRKKSRTAKKRPRPKGIYCIENDWWGKPGRQSSIEPMLELLSKWNACPVPYIRRDVATQDELAFYLRQCTRRGFSRYPIIYFALHGSRGTVHIGGASDSSGQLDVQELAKMLEGKCAGRILYFGCCETLDIHGNELRGILSRTHAKAVCGYRKNVDWLDSVAFETLLFGELQCRSLTAHGIRAAMRGLSKRAKSLAKNLGFRMEVR